MAGFDIGGYQLLYVEFFFCERRLTSSGANILFVVVPVFFIARGLSRGMMGTLLIYVSIKSNIPSFFRHASLSLGSLMLFSVYQDCYGSEEGSVVRFWLGVIGCALTLVLYVDYFANLEKAEASKGETGGKED